MNDAERSRMVEHPRVSRVVGGGVAAAIAVPFVVAAIRLSRMHPNAVLDIAQTELRVRNVFSAHPPLIGLPGRIGEFGVHTGSHPGPMSFYLLAPFYRLFGAVMTRTRSKSLTPTGAAPTPSRNVPDSWVRSGDNSVVTARTPG